MTVFDFKTKILSGYYKDENIEELDRDLAQILNRNSEMWRDEIRELSLEIRDLYEELGQ